MSGVGGQGLCDLLELRAAVVANRPLEREAGQRWVSAIDAVIDRSHESLDTAIGIRGAGIRDYRQQRRDGLLCEAFSHCRGESVSARLRILKERIGRMERRVFRKVSHLDEAPASFGQIDAVLFYVLKLGLRIPEDPRSLRRIVTRAPPANVKTPRRQSESGSCYYLLGPGMARLSLSHTGDKVCEKQLV